MQETLFSFDKFNQCKQASFLSASGTQLRELLDQHKLTSSEYDEMLKILGRSPTLAELAVFSAMWSEHCSYKSSRVHLKRFPTSGDRVVVGPGENAGVVRLKEDVCLAFKMESHNHPSFIEPYQGAATGVGGILRDVFCMGARPIANLNCLRFGSKSHEKTAWLFHEVVKGIGDYGNCIGVPTVGGNVAFHSRYNENILVNAMTVGVVKESEIFKGEASGVDNLVFYVGSATGRDGIHGATMASDSFDQETKEKERSAVQVGDPFCEKLLLEATLEVLKQGLVVGIQDMGAAGLTSSIFEMASRAGTGVVLDLNAIPTRVKNMTPYELLLSESQERMLMVVKPKNKEKVEQVFAKWELSYSVIGKIVANKRVKAYHNDLLHLDVPVDELAHHAPVYKRPIRARTAISNSLDEVNNFCLQYLSKEGWQKVAIELLKACTEKTSIYRQYDHHIGLKTVLGPDEGGAALLWLDQFFSAESYFGVAVATACCEHYCDIDPKKGAEYSVMKAARMIAAVGAKPLAVTDCLNYGNPEDPEIMWQFSQGVDGISDACNQLSIPVVSGNVSFYNQTNNRSVFPTPMIGMVGEMEDVRCQVAAIAKEHGRLYALSPKANKASFVGSLLADVVGCLSEGQLSDINYPAEKESLELLSKLSQQKYLCSARDIGRGGLFCCVVQMFSKQRAKIELTLPGEDFELLLFGEQAGCYLLLVAGQHEKAFLKEVASLENNKVIEIGKVTEGAASFFINNKQINDNEVHHTFSRSLQL